MATNLPSSSLIIFLILKQLVFLIILILFPCRYMYSGSVAEPGPPGDESFRLESYRGTFWGRLRLLPFSKESLLLNLVLQIIIIIVLTFCSS